MAVFLGGQSRWQVRFGGDPPGAVSYRYPQVVAHRDLGVRVLGVRRLGAGRGPLGKSATCMYTAWR